MLKFVCNRLPNTKLPLDICRGNETMRFSMSKKMSKKLFEQLPNEYYSGEQLRETVDKILAPHKINFTISDNTNEAVLGSVRLGIDVIKANPKEVVINIDGYNIQMKKYPNGLYSTFTAIHEFGHMFDHICNSKSITLRSAKVVFDDKSLTEVNNLLKIPLNQEKSMQNVRKFTKNILDNISDEIAIDTLQTIRSTLKTEMNQYKIGMQNLIKKKKAIKFINEFVFYREFRFEKKLKLVNKLLKERLAIARENLSKKRGD